MWKVRSSEAQENPVQATDVHLSCKESSESFYLITTYRVCGGELSRSHPGRTTTTTDHQKATLPDSLNTFYSQSDRLNTGTPSEVPVNSFTPQSATPGQQQNICYAAFPGLQFCFQHFPDKLTSKLSDMESRLQTATGSWILTERIQQRLLAAEENRTGVLASQPGLQRTDREHPHCTHHCLQC